MRRLDVLISTLSELTGRDREAVAATFDVIMSANPSKGAALLEPLADEEAAAMRESLLREGPGVLARLAEKLGQAPRHGEDPALSTPPASARAHQAE